MAEPFGKGDGGLGKRPAQTIEGTATEIVAEPSPAAGLDPALETKAGDGGPSQEAAEAARGAAGAPRTSLSGFKRFMTHLAAGFLGGLIGVIALALAWGALDLGAESSPPPELAGIQDRLAKLESAPAPPSADAKALERLDTRLAALEASSAQAATQLAATENRVAQLESSLKALADTASEGGSVASAAAIAQQIAEAEQRLNDKIAAVQAGGKDAEALAGLQKEIASIEAKVGALAEAELGAVDVGSELNALSERIAKLETLMPDLASSVGKESAQAKTAAIAIAFANLRAAVDSGRPYAAELDTLSTLAAAPGDLGILSAHAQTGIATLSGLNRSFAEASEKALVAAAPPKDASLLDKMMASAQSLVKIEKIGEAPAGEGPSAVIARAGAALGKGDLSGAVKEIETLARPPHDAFSTWLGEARARLGADETMTRLEGQLLISLSPDADAQQP